MSQLVGYVLPRRVLTVDARRYARRTLRKDIDKCRERDYGFEKAKKGISGGEARELG